MLKIPLAEFINYPLKKDITSKIKISATLLLVFLFLIQYSQAQQKPLNTVVSFTQLITAEAKISNGFFTTYYQDGKVYFEIPDSMLRREIIMVSRFTMPAKDDRGLPAAVPGDMIGPQQVIHFNKIGDDKIGLYNPSYALLPPSSGSQVHASLRSKLNLVPIKASFYIKAYGKNKNSTLIDVTEFIKNDDLFYYKASTINTIDAFKNNIEIGTTRKDSTIIPVMEINTSLVLLPKVPMKARFYDERIGYYKINSVGVDENGAKEDKLILKRRLEPKPADLAKYIKGELVEPQKPIVFYIDPAMPKKWVPYIIQGVKDWQPVFEKAGFKNAIYAQMAQTKQEDSTFRLEDAAHSAFIYKAKAEREANTPNIHDPRTGEILESHIQWYGGIMELLHDTYFIQASVNDPKARSMHYDDELIGQLARIVASHEIGHALGLEHNMAASSTVSVKNLRDKNWVKVHGHSASLMDYSRFNYVAQPGDGITGMDLFPRIGDYDRWAIEWGYRLYPKLKKPKEEFTYLSKWATTKLENPSLLYLANEEAKRDPRAQEEDLGDDAMKANEYGIANLKRIVPNLIEWTKDPDQNFDNLSNMYHEIIRISPNGRPLGQYSEYIGHVLKNIAGVYTTPNLVGDTMANTLQSVPKNIQKEAVAFLNKELFATPYWLLDTVVLTKINENPLSLIGNLQRITLDKLFRNNLAFIPTSETAMGKGAYTVSELLNDLKAGIWSELKGNEPITVYRKNLHKNYISILNRGPNGSNPTLNNNIKSHLEGLKTDLIAAITKSTSEDSKSHLKLMLELIQNSLKVKKTVEL